MTPTDLPLQHFSDDTLQDLCAQGSDLLRRTMYIEAERVLVRAEALALAQRDFDTLSRLYYPLQETRRQMRQLCGEGVVRLDLMASECDRMAVAELADRYPQGQFLVAGWRSVGPAADLRRAYRQRGDYAEVFLGAVFEVEGGASVVAVLPREVDLSAVPEGLPLDGLARRLPAHTILLTPGELPTGELRGTPHTFARTMAIWERLHLPFLAQADSMPISENKLAAYHLAVEVDYACEFAYQNAARTARELARSPLV